MPKDVWGSTRWRLRTKLIATFWVAIITGTIELWLWPDRAAAFVEIAGVLALIAALVLLIWIWLVAPMTSALESNVRRFFVPHRSSQRSRRA